MATKEERQTKKFIKEARKNKSPRVFDARIHYSWGNSIIVSDLNTVTGQGRIVGWLRNKPKNGDFLLIPAAGKVDVVMECIIYNVRYMMDPRDMFFADIQYDSLALASTQENFFQKVK